MFSDVKNRWHQPRSFWVLSESTVHKAVFAAAHLIRTWQILALSFCIAGHSPIGLRIDRISIKATGMAHPDLQALMDSLRPFAQSLLRNQGDFHPFGATMDSDGGIQWIAAETGESSRLLTPSST
jgi:hypothetical protein